MIEVHKCELKPGCIMTISAEIIRGSDAGPTYQMLVGTLLYYLERRM